MPASDHANDHPETPDADLRALAAALLKAIAAEPVPAGIADAALNLQQALAAAGAKGPPVAAEDAGDPQP
ncbi:hypothetical protein RNZ50_12055 [Paracoccaceae bacterium Fryx2]|nr:hypothetical protein [Paracoccaceae bacterium Fryx2]